MFYVFLVHDSLYHYELSLGIFLYLFYFEVCFIRYQYHYSHFSLNAICLKSHFHPFTLSLYLSLELRCVSWRQHMVGFCFLIHSSTLCLLIGEFSPFIFRVILKYEVFLQPFYLLLPGRSMFPLLPVLVFLFSLFWLAFVGFPLVLLVLCYIFQF